MRLIAEQAHLQDEAYRERVDPSRDNDNEVFKAAKTMRRGRSLNTLFLTSRAWSAAATPFLFSVSSSSLTRDTRHA